MRTISPDPIYITSALACADRLLRHAQDWPAEQRAEVSAVVSQLHRLLSEVGADECGESSPAAPVTGTAADPKRDARLLAEALRDCALAIAGNFDLDAVMDEVFATVSRVVTFDAAILALVDGDRVRNHYVAGYSDPITIQRIIEHVFTPEASPYMAALLKSRRPVIVADWRDDVDCRAITFAGGIPGDAASAAMVPILNGDTLIGVVSLLGRRANAFTPDHVDVLSAFAAQIAVALHSIRAFEQARALAVLEDRQRLARDLHDAVTQSLFSANVLVESLPRLWHSIPPRASSQLEHIQTLTRGALAEMRILLLELRPENLRYIDLPTALRQLVDAVRGRKRLHIQLKVGLSPVVGLSPEVQVAFYRIAQEALNNVVRHSRATRVDIQLAGTSGRVRLVIRDNGVGFDTTQTTQTSSGFGLQSISERARDMDATLDIVSTPGTGTAITVIWQPPASGEHDDSKHGTHTPADRR